MSELEKVPFMIVVVALATTLVLPGRETSRVINSIGGVFTGALHESMGG